MEQTYLPGKIRDRMQDLMKSNKVRRPSLLPVLDVRKVC